MKNTKVTKQKTPEWTVQEIYMAELAEEARDKGLLH